MHLAHLTDQLNARSIASHKCDDTYMGIIKVEQIGNKTIGRSLLVGCAVALPFNCLSAQFYRPTSASQLRNINTHLFVHIHGEDTTRIA